jgi:UDP-N-acetylmuramoyl-tripeptide--D-alanyl-D-alanine ligase
MIPLSAGEIARITGGTVARGTDPEIVTSGPVVIDSREVRPGSLFVAFAGEQADGHDFCGRAVEAGAALCLTTRPVDVPSVRVADPAAALADLARHVLSVLRDREDALTVLALTGSVGKTGVKDLLGTICAAAGETVSPPGSLNNELGVPLTVLAAGPATRYLVLEMGARGVGHIEYLTSIARPDVAAVLNVGTAHLGEFGSVDAIAAAKGEIVEALTTDGTAVLNADDGRVAALAGRSAGRALTWGIDRDDTDVAARDVRLDDLARPTFELVVRDGEEQTRRVALGLVGEHQVQTALAAASMALAAGIDLGTVAGALDGAVPASPHRMQLVERGDGVTVLNDAYNANPQSMAAALRALAVIGENHRTIAVLGEMLELGPDSTRFHADLGELVVRLNIDLLVAVGEGARAVHRAAVLEGSWGEEAVWVADADEAEMLLAGELRAGDVVLLKSSRDVGLRWLGERLAAPAGTSRAEGATA